MTVVGLAAGTTSPPAVSGWGLLAVAVLLVVLVKKSKATGNASGGSLRNRIDSLTTRTKNAVAPFITLYKVLRAIARFYAGRELNGRARSDATWLGAGTLTSQPKKAHKSSRTTSRLGSVAAPAPKVSLVKPRRRQPSPWARRTAAWLQGYQGQGAGFLDRIARTALWTVRWAGKTWRAVRAVCRALTAAYRTVAPPVAATVRLLRAWPCWPYAARSAARFTASALLVAWLIPALRPHAILAATLGSIVLGSLLPRVRPAQVGDDAVYGPRIWTVLRRDLELPEDEERIDWLQLPQDVAADGARIVVRLPWSWRGSDMDREALTSLINSRVPGEWVARFKMTGDPATATFTHKPPAKAPAPEPEPPAAVDIWDPAVQEVLAGLGPDEFYLGQDEFDRPVIQKMADEQAHWALSVGSGGGKSAMLHWLAVQMLMKRGTVVPIDPKMVSMTPLIGIQGVHSYVNPEAPYDMRRTLKWAAEVVKARNYEKKNRIRTAFEPLYLILEECNELADLLKEQYTADKESGDPAGDPIWRDAVAKILRLGREVNVHVIAVFQDFKDTQFGGVSLVPLFPFKIMGSFNERQWKRIIGTNIPMPTPQKKAGRMVLVLDNGDVTRIQVPYAPWNPEKSKDDNQKAAYSRLTAYYNELRATHGYSTEGLYEEPPQASPERAPAILGRASRDNTPRGPIEGLSEGLTDETAGRLSHTGGTVTLLKGDVTGQRDALRLIPGQGGQAAAQDPTAPPELLTLAEISRRIGPSEGVPRYDTLRQHKARRDDFPKGIEKDGKELFLISQITAYYSSQEEQRA
ncbi:hypothetical protein [Streptomyces sp. NPDC001297]|uniref:hypothetical protein n=1 Tax=Streptomyces sp. NPDC001297 TaxID=3364559 RepID=UPI00368C2828